MPRSKRASSPGGGVALLRAAEALDKVKETGDEAIGVEIIRRALEAPLRQIATTPVPRARSSSSTSSSRRMAIGYNAATGEYVDMFKAGIVDPTKVTRTALQNAASVAAMLLTTEAVITDIPEEEKAAAPRGAGGGMGDMY